eukprot:TRINITY_DN11476_c0_g1_i6.p2 TRINITY_DN11476_c0_g1~~TRINITY_DN11476_c0_g1_i6.p2  ORF type:complete len:163 (-),score=52.59 TRINITY_DN11476_c0_g1_i6:13-501(-)
MAQRDKISLNSEKDPTDSEAEEAFESDVEEVKDDDLESDTEHKGDEAAGGWGKKKREYYDADTKDFEIESDEEIALAEERESKRLQEERAKELDAGDFEVPLEHLIGKDQKLSKKKSKKPAKDLIGDLDAIQLQLGVSDENAEIGRAVQQECRDRSRMPSSA